MWWSSVKIFTTEHRFAARNLLGVGGTTESLNQGTDCFSRQIVPLFHVLKCIFSVLSCVTNPPKLHSTTNYAYHVSRLLEQVSRLVEQYVPHLIVLLFRKMYFVYIPNTRAPLGDQEPKSLFLKLPTTPGDIVILFTCSRFLVSPMVCNGRHGKSSSLQVFKFSMLIVAFGPRLLLYSPKYVSEMKQELDLKVEAAKSKKKSLRCLSWRA